ncbi:nucleoporin-interacting protein [Paenibacillus sp.]|uniref:nucleoporin-interacting protein n=1 Tax=Paenibacillus sp. TaxID=58172 RepID=UPI0028123399|nr:nucleoporin-interacting protein [Paenibacillus sp.]
MTPLRERPFLWAAAFAALLCALRLAYASPYASSWDAVDFALALDRFDLLAMQPHFPGYPFFVLAGMALRPWFGGDAVAALAGVGALAYASAVWPMYALARAALPAWPAAAAAALLQASAYAGLAAALPMSEAAALGALWWFGYAALAAFRSPRFAVRLLPAAAFGALMGIRLSYAAFGLLLLPLFVREWRSSRLRACGFLLAVAAAQLVWVAALVVTEGSLGGFLTLGVEFARGHFAEWGGAATTETSPALPSRFATLVFRNWLWIGVCGGSVWSAVALIAAAVAALAAVAGRRGQGRASLPDAAALRWLAAACAAYFLWALFAQNIDKPRHILPLIGPALWLLALGLHRACRGRRAVFAAAMAAALAGQLFAGLRLLDAAHAETPAVVQLHRYASERLEAPFQLLTWEETRVLGYLGAAYPHKRVYTFALAEEERLTRPDRRTYVTGKVVEGFAAQGVDVASAFAPVATFVSNAIVDPVYHEITLYEWKEEEKALRPTD